MSVKIRSLLSALSREINLTSLTKTCSRCKELRLNDPPDEEPRVLIEILPGKSARREVPLSLRRRESGKASRVGAKKGWLVLVKLNDYPSVSTTSRYFANVY